MRSPFNIIYSFFLLALAAYVIPITSHAEETPVLGYYVYGSGPEKIIVLHDWMGDSANYVPIIPYLDPATFTWVFADVRGYGLSKHLTGKYTVDEVAGDVFHLADHLGWRRFHVVGHSMNGMTVQRMAIDDWKSDDKRLKSIVAITPVTADGYPADKETKQFLWNAIHHRNLSEQAFSGLTGKKLSPAWSRIKTSRNLATSSIEAMQGYYKMWLETDFSEDVLVAKVGTPIRVIGGRQDLPGFQEKKYNTTLAVWYPNIEFIYITDAGHYPMQETPVRFAALVEEFFHIHQ